MVRCTGTAAWPNERWKELVKAINMGCVEPEPLNNGLEAGVSYSIERLTTSQSSLPPIPATMSTSFYPIEAPPGNYWCEGTGNPRVTTTLGKEDLFLDRGGLTSPGRWPRKQGRFPLDKRWTQLQKQLEKIVGSDETISLKQMAVLACHREDLFCSTSWVPTRRFS